MNDYFDLEVDRVNALDRPLAAGVLSPAEAIVITAVATLAGLAAAATAGLPAFMTCLLLWVIAFLYNWKLKSAGLAGNLMVSTCVAMTFLLGGMIAGQPWNKVVWTFGLMAFFLDLG